MSHDDQPFLPEEVAKLSDLADRIGQVTFSRLDRIKGGILYGLNDCAQGTQRPVRQDSRRTANRVLTTARTDPGDSDHSGRERASP